MSKIIFIILLSIGVLFNLFGCIGLLRLPDVYNRLQSATKCVTLGTCSILAGAVIYLGPSQEGIKAVLCILFILFTSPTAAHAISRGAHIYGVKTWDKTVVDKYEGEVDKKLHWGKEVK